MCYASNLEQISIFFGSFISRLIRYAVLKDIFQAFRRFVFVLLQLCVL